MPTPDRHVLPMVMARHVILSGVEESPVYSIGRVGMPFVDELVRGRLASLSASPA